MSLGLPSFIKTVMVTRSIRLPYAATHRLYIGVSLLVAAIACIGFWPTYFGPLLAGTVNKLPLIHFHATVYVG